MLWSSSELARDEDTSVRGMFSSIKRRRTRTGVMLPASETLSESCGLAETSSWAQLEGLHPADRSHLQAPLIMLNPKMTEQAEPQDLWLFGYGSLIWKPPPHYGRLPSLAIDPPPC